MEQLNSYTEKPFAVITDATSNLGRELAWQFAKNDYDLLIVSESEKIEDIRFELEDLGREVFSFQTDLSTYIGVENLCLEINSIGRSVDVLVINTALGSGGAFIDTKLKDEFHLMRLNIYSPVHLVKRVLKKMVARKAGKILFVSPNSPTSPAPFESVYGASAAFLVSFSDSLRNEIKEYGISVTTLMPGSFGSEESETARMGFEALLEGRNHVYSESFKTKIQGLAHKYIPSWFAES